MKTKFITALALLPLLLIGCGGTDPSQKTDWHDFYSETIAAYHAVIIDRGESGDVPPGSTGVLEAAVGLTADEAMQRIGYAVTDLSGDGIPELMIGSVGEDAGGTAIYAVYTAAGDTPVFVFGGWPRSSFRSMEDGSFWHHGSASAMLSGFGRYTLSLDGTALTCREFYFRAEDAQRNVPTFWRNTTGEMDITVSDKLDITEDAFWELEETLSDSVRTLEMTPFSSFTPETNPVTE